jgi:hypothetical protein
LVRLAVATAAACGVAVTVIVLSSPDSHESAPSRAALGLAAPVAAGDSAANIELDGPEKRVLVRWVARSSGTLSALHLRIQADGAVCRRNGQTEYGLGDGGGWRVTTYPVLADGRPDLSTPLQSTHFRPCTAQPDVVDVRQGIVRIAMWLRVERGSEYATAIRNDAPDAGRNYTSTNFLFTDTGIVGANGRNERDPRAPDAYYGLDPRELVGYSQDAGRSWSLPGGPYGGAGGRSFLPTYLQEYANGQITGQPYYYTAEAATTTRHMVFGNITRPWTIRALGAYTASRSTGTLTLAVDGRTMTTARVSGSGMLRVAIPPTTVRPGGTVIVTATGLTLRDVVADTAWGRLAGMHLHTTPWRLQWQPDFSRAAPVYPLPAPPVAPARQLPAASRGRP